MVPVSITRKIADRHIFIISAIQIAETGLNANLLPSVCAIFPRRPIEHSTSLDTNVGKTKSTKTQNLHSIYFLFWRF